MTTAKAPDAAVVAQAQDALDTGDDLTKREAKALAEQNAIDEARGYTHEPWKPGVWHYRALVGHDTALTETEIIRKVNEQRIAAAALPNPQG